MQDSAPPKTDPGPIHQVAGWHAALLWVVGLLVRVWCRTLRTEVAPDDRANAAWSDVPATIMLWHNRLFAVPLLLRMRGRRRPLYALVSASRDGAGLSTFLGFLGLKTVRGSSSRFGREALQQLIAVQRDGNDIAITPDGPRGPVYQMKAGALLAARRTRSPVLLFGLIYRRAWHLRSWDRFGLPVPFSKVVVKTERLDPNALGKGEEAIAVLRRRLMELSGESPEAWPEMREIEVAAAEVPTTE